jgi:PAS domain S-box-containing protein/diguanylate cyclase (GGDEF)-like protein
MRQARRAAEQALRKKEQRLRDIVETSQDWIWELDAEGRYVFSNRAVKDLLGYRPNDLHGRPHLEFAHPDDRAFLEQTCERMKREGYGMTGIVARWCTKAGEHRWLEKNALPLFDEHGKFCGLRGTDRDVTKRMVHELTGLPNRALFCERIARALPALAAQGLPLVVLAFDLERLSTINTSFGRLAGDKLLQFVAERMQVVLGDTRSMAHLSGGTFAVVFTDLVEPQDAAHILRNEVSRFFVEPFVIGDQTIRVSAKSGISRYPQDGNEPEILLQRAEAALRRAKESGEQYLHYKLQMNTQIMERLALESRLQQALVHRQFELYYQPTVSFASGRIQGAEALIRWNDPEVGVVPPGQFIPVLESTGMILEVGQWALREAAAQALKWRGLDLPPVRIAVNVSPVQLKRREFTSEVLAVLGRGTAKSVDLDLEITESMLMNELEVSTRKLQELRALGVKIALDDFGTGFSSLSRLAKLPIDTLKIDRSFIQEITADGSARAVVATIVSLAHAFKMKAVAEGVETRAQFELLRELKCDQVQGYLISAPVPAEKFAAMLSEDGARVRVLQDGVHPA